MKYNEKYDRYVDDDLVIYRYDKNKDKLVQVKPYKSKGGYMCISCTLKTNYHKPIYLHRFLWETFMGEIPQGYQIDHINTIRTDNRLENLRLVTCKENHNNPLTIKHKLSALEKIWEANKGRKTWNAGLKGSSYKNHYKNGFKNQYSEK